MDAEFQPVASTTINMHRTFRKSYIRNLEQRTNNFMQHDKQKPNLVPFDIRIILHKKTTESAFQKTVSLWSGNHRI